VVTIKEGGGKDIEGLYRKTYFVSYLKMPTFHTTLKKECPGRSRGERTGKLGRGFYVYQLWRGRISLHFIMEKKRASGWRREDMGGLAEKGAYLFKE